MADVHIQGDPIDVAQKIVDIPLYLSGQKPDPSGAIRDALTAVGMVTLGNIYNHFDKMSRGGQGDDGTVWDQLSVVTLALRNKDTSGKAIERLVSDLTGKNGKLSSSRRRMFLNNAKRMRAFYEKGANARARRRALQILKLSKPYISDTRYNSIKKELEGIGKKPLKRKTLNRLVFAAASALILRNNNDLFNSLQPYLGALGQLFELGPGYVDVGTQMDYAKYHQSPEPRKLKADGKPILPRRPFLPDIIPDIWYDDAVRVLHEIMGSPDWIVRFIRG